MQFPFDDAFRHLTGNAPFPWQSALYERFIQGDFPDACNLPTGLGKTNVIAVWLIALLNEPSKIPRRLVYVVNRRTVVDQTTDEVEKIRKNLETLPGLEESRRELAISTLRGQYADNREWSADPSRPAVICGTVDMIGSRLLFSGYNVGFKGRPLHAGFLGQDALLVHDEAHLEPAFQQLITTIAREQRGGRLTADGQCEVMPGRTVDFRPMRVMALTATPRGAGNVFELTSEESNVPPIDPADASASLRTVWKRMKSPKAMIFHSEKRDAVAKRIGMIARDKWKGSDKAILIFAHTLNDVQTVYDTLTDKKNGGVNAEQIQFLTGIQRGLERDQMANPRTMEGCPVFARFLTPPKENAPSEQQWKIKPKDGTVYLICTSAGEVGVDISADHMVCDLTTLDSMAQRLGRVNRRGEGEAFIDVVHEIDRNPKPTSPKLEAARWNTKAILDGLPKCNWFADEDRKEASPLALRSLNLTKDERDAAFAPPPPMLPATDILFDAWALTTIRDKLPGRPPVDEYLHGQEEETTFQTNFAWREEVSLLSENVSDEIIADLLDEYPIRPHELLHVNTFGKGRAYTQLEAIAERMPDCPVWLIQPDGSLRTFQAITELVKKRGSDYIVPLAARTIVLPPKAGALDSHGILDGKLARSELIKYDVAGTPPAKVEPLIRLIAKPNEDGYSVKLVAPVKDWPVISTDCPREEKLPLWLNGELAVTSHPRVRILTRIDFFDSIARDNDSDAPPSQYLVVRAIQPPKEAKKLDAEWPSLTAHLTGVQGCAESICSRLNLGEDLTEVVTLAAAWHDLGKSRAIWQNGAGNSPLNVPVAKTLHGRAPDSLNHYRHELGSLVDLTLIPEYAERFNRLKHEQKELVPHLIATHHGRGRPHFPSHESVDPESSDEFVEPIVIATTRRFASLQRQYGRWGLAYLESLLRAADAMESRRIQATPIADAELGTWPERPKLLLPSAIFACPTPSIRINVDVTNPGQFFACCGLLELADRLWPGAEGWFEESDFCISCDGVLKELLRAARLTQLADDDVPEDERDEDEDGDDDDDSFRPIAIKSPFSMHLDWWQDKSLKTWAGSMNARKILLAMCGAINEEEPDPFNQSQVVYDPILQVSGADKKTKRKGTPREPFQFDSRRGANALGLDVGFIPDSLKKKWKVYMWTHPAVEFLCLIGLQRCRPTPTKNVRVFDYFTWSTPCQAAVLPVAVNGLFGDPFHRAFRFKNIFRTGQKKHKAFTQAVPLSNGDSK